MMNAKFYVFLYNVAAMVTKSEKSWFLSKRTPSVWVELKNENSIGFIIWRCVALSSTELWAAWFSAIMEFWHRSTTTRTEIMNKEIQGNSLRISLPPWFKAHAHIYHLSQRKRIICQQVDLLLRSRWYVITKWSLVLCLTSLGLNDLLHSAWQWFI